jgi:hypothetical protein
MKMERVAGPDWLGLFCTLLAGKYGLWGSHYQKTKEKMT